MHYETEIQRLIAQLGAHSLLCVGPDAAVLAPYIADDPSRLTQVTGADCVEQIERLGVFDFAWVSGMLEQLDKSQGTLLLARLRDLHTRFLAVLALVSPLRPGQTCWTESDFLALGLVRQGHYNDAHRRLTLYTFDLATYKVTPDWFNPKYWAHPERWDKAWW